MTQPGFTEDHRLLFEDGAGGRLVLITEVSRGGAWRLYAEHYPAGGEVSVSTSAWFTHDKPGLAAQNARAFERELIEDAKSIGWQPCVTS